jgi:hypothetical protein
MAHYSLGFNFDPDLIDGIADVNAKHGRVSKIEEVFGALPDSPISSARPTSRIPSISFREFEKQLKRLRESEIEFNFLMNTSQALSAELEKKIRIYLKQLIDVGVQRLTIGSPELCAYIKSLSDTLHITISITYGIRSTAGLKNAEVAGADAVYLDGVFVNRNFELLRALLTQARVECRLYANMSCISQCPVVHSHYGLFAGVQSESTSRRNDAFFAGCTAVKLRNPVEWLQMPWIRPEDIPVYKSEGVSHFKLADRLAPTDTLLLIARSYLTGNSPDNLFELVERDGAKYKNVRSDLQSNAQPMNVRSAGLPKDFISHFRSGACKSNDVGCEVCLKITHDVVHVNPKWADHGALTRIDPLIPSKLRKRVALPRGMF